MTWTTRLRSRRAGLAAIEAGCGKPIILLHGVGLRSEAWNRQIDVLAEGYHVMALDMPGHGESPIPSSTMRLADYSNAVLATVDEPAIMVGHSMGAMIALDIACRHPERILGVVALNAIFERSSKAADAVQRRASALDGLRLPDPSQTLERWFANKISPERVACEDWLTSVDPAGYKMAYEAFAQGNGPDRDKLVSLNCPALFMTGALEENSTPQMSNTMADLTPKGRAIIVDNAAHMMPMTHPDAVNEALLGFAGQV